NLTVNGQFYALSVLDSGGAPVTSFQQAVSIFVTAPLGTDPSTISIAALDSVTGTLQALQTQITDDGRVAVLVANLAAPASLQPAPPSDASPAVTGVAPDGQNSPPTDPALAPTDGAGQTLPDPAQDAPQLEETSA
ncbi:MAG TPA: hypothetical protein VFB50_06155, partial [Chloroflexota bacterium]|nr:hypothetical protein [Chloroflexota bacterium]